VKKLLEIVAPYIKAHNNHMQLDSKKRSGFHYAPAAPLFATGDVSARSLSVSINKKEFL